MESNFTKVQFEHNRLFLLLNSKYGPTVDRISVSGPSVSQHEANSSSLMDHDLYLLLQMSPNIIPLEYPITQSLQETLESCLNYRISMGKLEYYSMLINSNTDLAWNVCGHVFRNGEPVYRCLLIY